MLLNSFEPSRLFEFDYVLFDALFLAGWLFLLIKKKKWNALYFGIFCAAITWMIDALWWWNAPYQDTFIREYFIGGMNGVEVHSHLQYLPMKLACDFMMTISYSSYAFPWMWIMYEYIDKNASEGGLNREDWNSISIFTSYYFGAWMLLPFFMYLIPLNNTLIYTVRHMDTQIIVWIINLFVGYTIFALIYGTRIIKKLKPEAKNQKPIILYVLLVGCLESFFMEFPLFIWGIRPTDPVFLIIEIILLVNQGAPYLYIAYDIVLPYAAKGVKHLLDKDQNINAEKALELKNKH